jgi:hypothetical protein
MKGMQKICEQCGQRYHAERKERKFCGRRCADINRGLKFRGQGAPWYKGGWVGSHGYRVVSVNRVQTLEHRRLMEEHLGRQLETNEHVHHIDGDKHNNSIDNLELLSPREHKLLHCQNFRSETHKQCAKCRETKPRTEFHPERTARPGHDPHRSHCKVCANLNTAERRARKRSFLPPASL